MSIYRLKGTAGSVINQSFSLENRLLIGGSTDCDIRIDGADPDIALAEVAIEADGSVILRALSIGSDVSVNGAHVSVANLRGGDEIRLGGCRLILQVPGLKPERVLTQEAIRPRQRALPWVLAATLVAAGTALAWYYGWLEAFI